jgi:DNA-binding transcriptional ArsR family regulator
MKTDTNSLPDDTALTALGSDVRRQIIVMLGASPLSAGQIAQAFPISRPAISKHLKRLQEAGLIAHEAQGNRNIYCLDTQGFQAASLWLNAFWPDALQRFRMVTENTYQGDNDV